MRLALVSDIHGNLAALEAVLADLRETAPDVVLHGGDLADGGPNPAETLDRIRELGWQGVFGNADEMLFRPDSLDEFARGVPGMEPLFKAVREIRAWTQESLGEEKIAWLRGLPRIQIHGSMALVHASAASTWISPSLTATDAELASTCAPLGRPVIVYGHIHAPFIRQAGELTVANSGSVSLSYDGDNRASYLLLDESPGVHLLSLRRVPYDIGRSLSALRTSGMPRADWVAAMLRAARPLLPE